MPTTVKNKNMSIQKDGVWSAVFLIFASVASHVMREGVDVRIADGFLIIKKRIKREKNFETFSFSFLLFII